MIHFEVPYFKGKMKKFQVQWGIFNSMRKKILFHLFFEYYSFQKSAAATPQMVHPLSPIFDNLFGHFDW